MNFNWTIGLLMILATMQIPCATYAAEEDAELAQIAAEQHREDEQLGEINSALKDSINTEPTQETDREIRERRKKLQQTRKEKEKINERKLKEISGKKPALPKKETIVIESNEEPASSTPQPVVQPKPTPKPVVQPKPTPKPVVQPKPTPQPVVQPKPTPQPVQTPPVNPPPVTPPPPTRNSTPKANPNFLPTPAPVETYEPPNEKVVYSNFVEVAQAMHFVPLYMSRKSGYDIVGIVAGQGIVEIRYGRRWEPNVALAVRTYKRAQGEEPSDISGVTGVKWRVDTSTGTTIYIAKISDTEQVAAWAVGQYTFSAQAKNLSFAGFHSLVADELVELSTHYYINL